MTMFRRLFPRFYKLHPIRFQHVRFTRTDGIDKKSPSTYFVTSPIFYVNAAPHLGHLYSTTLVDASHRFQLMLETVTGTIFCTGTDEHGLKVQQAAGRKGQPIRFFCDNVSSKFQELFNVADIQYTSFVRTTQDSHVQAVQHFWVARHRDEELKTVVTLIACTWPYLQEVLQNSGNIYKGKYEGWYCVSEETFLTETQLMEKDSENGQKIKVHQSRVERLKQNELIVSIFYYNGKVSIESGQPVEWMAEPNYMFPLSNYKDDLLHWLRNADVVRPQKFGDILKRMIEEGLNDISVSRSTNRLQWGIRVPGDDTQTIYVWLDALVAYLTAAGYPSENVVWPPDVQVIGKDILKFHGIYWPAFLMAAGLEPPHRIFCHSHWTVDNHKMSKSLGNVIDPFAKISASSSDAVRYFLLREGVPHSDGNYSEEKFVTLINAELCNTLGNLLSRCTAPALNESQLFPKFHKSVFDDECIKEGKDLITMVLNLPVSVKENYLDFNFYKGLESIMGCLRQANLFVQEMKPWELKKEPSKQALLDTVLHTTMETLRVVGILLLPITPVVAQRLLDKLGIDSAERRWKDLNPFVCVCGNKNSPYEGRPLGDDKTVLVKRINVDSTSTWHL